MDVTVLRRALVPADVDRRIRIARTPPELYAYCRDLSQVAAYADDVERAVQLSPTRYRWRITGPAGLHVALTVVVTVDEPPHRLSYRTTGPRLWRAEWQLTFAPDLPNATTLRQRLHVPLGAAGRLGLAVLGKAPDAETQRALENIKTAVENQPPSRPRPGEAPP